MGCITAGWPLSCKCLLNMLLEYGLAGDFHSSIANFFVFTSDINVCMSPLQTLVKCHEPFLVLIG